jgi:iron complex outermembrane receptor protein
MTTFSRPARAATLSLLSLATTHAWADPASSGNVVVVTGTRNEHASFDLPASIDVVDAEGLDRAQPRVNLSEALVAVPGLVVQNRQNYAQDLQISSRGFGARSAFGVRGVRLITDGVPATMPDGQGQAATFDLDIAERIEVLRGPFSALYGNHSGGVVQLFTREPKGAPALETTVSAGSDGMRKVDVNAIGTAGGIGFLLDASRFDTDGYRSHSAATREQDYAKLTFSPTSTGKLTVVAGGLRQHDTQDPLGVTWATWQRDPRAGETDTSDPQSPQRTYAERYNTRKSIDQQQIGATWDQRFDAGRLRVTLYGGNRHVIQYQAFSKAFQAPATHSGGVVDFERDFHGIDANWYTAQPLFDGTLRATVGVEAGSSNDARKGYENFVGSAFGVQGRLRRDEDDDVSNVDPYAQLEWERGRWLLSAGLRHSRVDFEVADHFRANGDDSGSVRYSHTTPLLGAIYHVTPLLNVYASAARGFETPTLNEVFYSGTGGGFNFSLAPAQSTHFEAGAKLLADDGVHVNAAVFQVRTTDELVVDSSSGGRTSYRNANSTLRQGLELSADATWRHNWNGKLALSVLRAVYDQDSGAIVSGSRLPGVPNANAYAELAWNDDAGHLQAAFETIANAKVYPDDANQGRPAPGYLVANLRVQGHQQYGHWRLREYARLNNLFDRDYIGSVIVGDANRRFYEGAPGRNWAVGTSVQYQF